MSLPAPMREAPLVVRCDRCDQPATGRCLRCDRPACDDHLPGEGRRCGRCEADLDRRLTAAEPAAIDADRYLSKTLRVGVGGPVWSPDSPRSSFPSRPTRRGRSFSPRWPPVSSAACWRSW